MHQPAARFRFSRPRGLEAHGNGASCRRSTIAPLPIVDLVIRTEDAYRMVKRLAREEAMLVSPSAAAALVGCLQVAASLDGTSAP